jgi:uncharacterized protein involved in exopolysaccharide biosynthesis
MTTGIETAPSGADVESSPPAEDRWDAFTGPVLGVRELKAALRRRRRLWLGTAAAGLVIGAALHVVLPHSAKAVSNLYLVEPPGSTPSVAMAGEVSLLQTRAVAQQAASSLPGHPAPESVATSYQGVAASSSILSVTAKARSAAAAVALDNAVAKAFLTVRRNTINRQTGIVVAGLQAQIEDLQRQTDPDQFQISQLQTSLLTTQLNARSSIDGSFVLDPAEAQKVSTKKRTIEDVLGGIVAGLALGAGFVVVGGMLSDRARRREDVAAALGVEVELSVPRTRRRPWVRWRREEPGPDSTAAMIERRLRANLDSAPGWSLATFAVAAERVAALATARLAASLVSEGRTVVVLDMAEGRPIGRLHRLKADGPQVHRVDVHGRPLTVVVAPDDPAQGVGPLDRGPLDIVLVLASVDPAFGVEHVATWASDAVVIVTAGKATYAGLDGAGRMMRQAGIAVRSAILVGADRDDDSVGLHDANAGPSVGPPTIRAIPPGEW